MKDLFHKDKSGLKYLVICHRITGITYLGWDFGKITSFWVKTLYIVWQCCLFIPILYFTLNEQKEFYNKVKQKANLAVSPKSGLMFLLYQTGNHGFILTVVYCFILLLFRGRKMLVFLQEQHFKPESQTERWIGIKTLIIQFGLTFTIEVLLFPILRLLKNGPNY